MIIRWWNISVDSPPSKVRGYLKTKIRALKALYLFTDFIYCHLMIKTLFNRGQTHLAIVWVPGMPSQHLVSHERPHWQAHTETPLTGAANNYRGQRWKCWQAHWRWTDFTYRKPHYLDLSLPFLILMITRENVPIYPDVFRTLAKTTDHYFFFNFYWSIVDWQCYISFCCTVKWTSYIYIYVYIYIYIYIYLYVFIYIYLLF